MEQKEFIDTQDRVDLTLDNINHFVPKGTSGIYQLKFGNNDIYYIGASHNITYRLYGHLSAFKDKKHTTPMQEHCNSIGLYNITFTILEECYPFDLSERQLIWISRYNGCKLLNQMHSIPAKWQKHPDYNMWQKEAIERSLNRNVMYTDYGEIEYDARDRTVRIFDLTFSVDVFTELENAFFKDGYCFRVVNPRIADGEKVISLLALDK